MHWPRAQREVGSAIAESLPRGLSFDRVGLSPTSKMSPTAVPLSEVHLPEDIWLYASLEADPLDVISLSKVRDGHALLLRS